MNSKVLLCCIVKLENLYIEEWVKYYQALGIDKIVIYDNDDNESEYVENVAYIKNLINSDYIDVYHIPNKIKAQCEVYTLCYNVYKEYDWFLFFDIDEYLTIESSDIHTQLSKKIYKNFDMIHVNWKLYDDNDLIYINNNYSIQERFTRPLNKSIPTKSHLDKEIKTILRGHLNNIAFTLNPHTITNQYLKCCDAVGNPISSIEQKNKYVVHKEMWLNHYITKTLEEYVTLKLKRKGGITTQEPGVRYNFTFFFVYNKKTSEKVKVLKELLSKYFSEEDCQKIIKGDTKSIAKATRTPEILLINKCNPYLKSENNIIYHTTDKKTKTLIPIIKIAKREYKNNDMDISIKQRKQISVRDPKSSNSIKRTIY